MDDRERLTADPDTARELNEAAGGEVIPVPDETDVQAYVGVSMRSTLDDLATLTGIASEQVTESDTGWQALERLGFSEDGNRVEQAMEHLYALPLCVERTVCFEIVLGTGGPDRRIVVECDTYDDEVPYEIRRVLYRYSWSGSAEVELIGEDRETAEAFARQVVPELIE